MSDKFDSKDVVTVEQVKELFKKPIRYTPDVLLSYIGRIFPPVHLLRCSRNIRVTSKPALFSIQGKCFFHPNFNLSYYRYDPHYPEKIPNLHNFVSKPVIDITVIGYQLMQMNPNIDQYFNDLSFTFYLTSELVERCANDGYEWVTLKIYTVYKGEKIDATISLIDFESDRCKNATDYVYYMKPLVLPSYYRVMDDEIVRDIHTPFDKNIVVFDIHDMLPCFDNEPRYWLGKEVPSEEDGTKLYKRAEFTDIIAEDGAIWYRASRARIVNSVSGPMAYIPYRILYGTNPFSILRKDIPIINVGKEWYPEYGQVPQGEEEKVHHLVSLTYHEEDDKNV